MGAAAGALNPMPWNLGKGFDQAPPLVVFSWHVALANVLDALWPPVRFAVSVILSYTHCTPLKWEPHGAAVAWGEGLLVPCAAENRVSLLQRCLH